MSIPRLVLFLASVWPATSQESASPSVVVPELGRLHGKHASDGIALFLGIPYAKAPIGKLRWMEPQAYGAWGGLRNASEYANSCAGAAGEGLSNGESEDCLYLNVASRVTNMSSAQRPVMVWIHGGTFNTGSGSTYVPENMVKAAKTDVVLVTINYRINVFGFLGSKSLAARSGSTGNYGLQDQQLAIKWVRDHISAFGGLGDDITIFGESAGGNSVLTQMVLPSAQGLYQKAIIESGTYVSGYALADADKLCNAIIDAASCADYECFLNASTKVIRDAITAVVHASKLALLHWGPVVDNVFNHGSAQELIAQGRFNKDVPIIMGTNRDEFAAFTKSWPGQMTEEQFDQKLAYLGADRIKDAKRLYAPGVYDYPKKLGAYSKWYWMAMRIATDSGIPMPGFPVGPALGHCSARRVADNLIRHGAKAVFLYNDVTPILSFGNFVKHGLEIPLVFNLQSVLRLSSPGTHALSSAVVDYWTAFAAQGTPSDPSLPTWPEYQAGAGRPDLRLGTTFLGANLTVEYEFRRDACDFWDALEDDPSAAKAILV